MPPVIQTLGLTKDYGQGRGVFDLDLQVEEGEVFGYLGPNGAGKSTTIRMLLDMVRPTRGTAELFGEDPRLAGPELRRRVAYVPGELNLWAGWTAREIISYLLDLHGGGDPGRVASLAERLRLDLDRVVGALSKGNKQKVGLVAAFAPKVDLLILDEPTSGLDPLLQVEFIRMVRESAADGTSVLLSSHVLSEVEHVADRVGIIRRGRLVDVLGVEALKSQAARTLEVTFEGPVPAALGELPGVRLLVTDGAVGRFEVGGGGVPGAVDAFVKALATHTVVGLRGEDADLEQVFLRYYDDGAGAGSGGAGSGGARPGGAGSGGDGPDEPDGSDEYDQPVGW